MSKGSVAPKERINIKYVPATGDKDEQVELPLKTVVLGDFMGRSDDRPIESRESVSIDKNTFESVMQEMGLSRDLEVKNRLQDEGSEATLNVSLNFESLKDFDPDSVAQQVPELRKMVELRDALTALKGPLGNLPQFRKALSEIMDDPKKREAVLAELEAANESEQ